MELDDLLFCYYGARELADVPAATLNAGIEQIQEDLGRAQNPGQRIALWCLLHLLGEAPDPDVAFKDEAAREAARNFMNLLAAQS